MSNTNDWYIVCDKKVEQSSIFQVLSLITIFENYWGLVPYAEHRDKQQ